MEVFFLVIVFIVIMFFAVGVFMLGMKKRSHKKKELQKIYLYLKKVSLLPCSQKILEYDKILDKCLFIEGYRGTTGNKMKKHGKKFVNTNAIWNAHKLRNKIAHEINFSLTDTLCKKSEKSFLTEIHHFL